MKTEAQRRAENAYRKKLKQIVVRFNPSNAEDEELYAWVKSQENAMGYLKNLIAEDMKNSR